MNIASSLLTVGLWVAGFLFIISLLPTTGTLPSGIATSIVTMLNYIRSYGFFIDYVSLFKVVGYMFAIEGTIMVVQIIGTIVRWIRGTSS